MRRRRVVVRRVWRGRRIVGLVGWGFFLRRVVGWSRYGR